ncbi:MAG: hypothetical protein JJ867_14175 [Marinobacter sp.]|nr:hypothetical protein [Marinobacter sp.]
MRLKAVPFGCRLPVIAHRDGQEMILNSRGFVTSNIIGATTLPQLEENISSVGVSLGTDAIHAIEAIHRDFTFPCP